MKTKFITIISMLLSCTLGVVAQNRIKAVDITIEIPKVGADAMDEVSVKSVIADAFGSQNMLGEDKISASVQVLKFDDYGNLCHLEVGDIYEAGRKYKFIVHTTNYTEILYNYKNDKNYTVDNTMVKATINGQKANITIGSGRPLICETLITMPGTRAPLYTNMAVSEPDGEQSGFGYVDLGLPSGTMWATCNIGASKPEALGDKYGYGETKTKKTFTTKNFIGYGAYTLSNPFGIQTFDEEDEMYSIKTQLGRRLKSEYDAATQNMGSEWYLPTRAQCNELRENCYVKYVRVNGVEGSLYTSRKNGKSIFLPFIGKFEGHKIGGASIYMTANSNRVRDMYLYWWGSSYSFDENTGICLFQNNTYQWNEDEIGGAPTCEGYYVRAVWGGKNKISSKSGSGKKSKVSEKKSDDDSKGSGESKKDKKDAATKTLKKIGKGLGKFIK